MVSRWVDAKKTSVVFTYGSIGPPRMGQHKLCGIATRQHDYGTLAATQQDTRGKGEVPMCRAEFQRWLEQFPADNEVVAWDPDVEGWFPITGAVVGHGEIRLTTAEDDDEDASEEHG